MLRHVLKCVCDYSNWDRYKVPDRVDCCEGYFCDIAPDDSYARCTPNANQCGLDGEFCGRGPTRKECCSGYHCNIAPNDSYAYCDKDSETTCETSGASCGRVADRVDCCPGYYCFIAPNDAYAFCAPDKCRG